MSLSSVVPVGTVLYVATNSAYAAWILGLTYVALGLAWSTVAVLATHVEYLCGARVWRSNHRFYFAR